MRTTFRVHLAAKYLNKGFTLIELLVVISIIALVVSILLPALKNARETAYSVRCLAGVRQTSFAVTLYTQDHKNKFPEYKSMYPSASSWDYNIKAPCEELTRREALGQYLNIGDYGPHGIAYALGLTFCPSNEVVYFYNEHLLGSDGHGGTPGANRWGSSTPGSSISIDQITRPSEVFWSGDYQLNQWEYYGHQGGRNISFVDAHAAHVSDEDREEDIWGDLWILKPLTWPY